MGQEAEGKAESVSGEAPRPTATYGVGGAEKWGGWQGHHSPYFLPLPFT